MPQRNSAKNLSEFAAFTRDAEFSSVMRELVAFAESEGYFVELTKGFMKYLARIKNTHLYNRNRVDPWAHFAEFLETSPHEIFWDAIRGLYAERRLQVEQARDNEMYEIQRIMDQQLNFQMQSFTSAMMRYLTGPIPGGIKPGNYELSADLNGRIRAKLSVPAPAMSIIRITGNVKVDDGDE